MMADHGTNRYILYDKRRKKAKKSKKAVGSGTADYSPMYKTEQTKTAGQIRTNNTPLYHMMDNGGKAKLIPRKKIGGDCGCKGGSVNKFSGFLYNK